MPAPSKRSSGIFTRPISPIGRLLACAIGLAIASIAASDPASADDEPASGKRIFSELAQPPCSLCHTLSDAGSTGEIGPSLDALRPDSERAERAIREGVGVMPPYRDKLSDEAIKAVAEYVARASGGAR